MMLLLANIRDADNIQAIWLRILDLVGNFDLDPDRVLDLVVEARVNNYRTHSYLRILGKFRQESITAVIGNKLKLIKSKPIESTLFEKTVYTGPI